MSAEKIKKQVVVIIHGIGEQKPMDTLRSFIEGIKSCLAENDASELNSKIWSKPDKISELFETRRLRLSESEQRPATDFLEFYWAHNMRDTKTTHILKWLVKLLFTWHTKIPPRLKKVWFTLWGIFAALTAVSVAVLLIWGLDNVSETLGVIGAWGGSIVLTLLLTTAKATFLNYAGDAGRYFSPIPDNIKERYTIRKEGLNFLTRVFQQVNERKYDRVILVGHSLGSVIAYDLLRLMWTDYNTKHNKPMALDQTELEAVDKICKDDNAFTGKKECATLEDYQDAQYRCWLKQKSLGSDWYISDFITIGAALCSADYLNTNNLTVQELIQQREFPICPPLADEVDKDDEKVKKIYYNYDYEPKDNAGKTRTIKVLHHAAPFAVTRWTNIYFSSDFVGGDMRRLFGKGIKEVEIKRRSGFPLIPGGHTEYWDKESKESLKAIVDALRLRQDSNPGLVVRGGEGE